jgi:outer membrane protein assembly factor BamB
MKLRLLFLVGVLAGVAQADSWPMLGRDMQHTGRADYVIPESRLNSGLFDVFRWQTPAPGGVGASGMVFTDRPGQSPEGVVAAGYHWPKGVQVMDRHNGALLWAANPRGGESIGDFTPAFSLDGQTVYVINDATESEEWPSGHPLMAMAVDGGGLSYRHNGLMSEPWLVQMRSPTIAPDGRIFAHAWVNRPGAALDTGSELVDAWTATTGADCGNSDPTLFWVGGQLRVVIAGRNGWVRCYDGTTGSQLWARNTYSSPYTISLDATVTVDPATGNLFVGGFNSTRVFVVGLNSSGGLLWSTAGKVVATGSNHRVQNAGCLSHDGATYYFASGSQSSASGALYAINTTDGTVKWTFATSDQQDGEQVGSCPVVTPNGVVLFGANWAGRYYAVQDAGATGVLVDELVVAPGGAARCAPTLSGEGLLYLPLKTEWTTRNAGAEPDHQVRDLYAAVDLSATPHELPPVCALVNPTSLMAFALNGQVRLEWPAVVDPAGCFAHYRVYRDTAPFSSVEGMTPVAELDDHEPGLHLDGGLVNGQAYWYAVTAVDLEGSESTAVTSVGPRRPFDESDLQVACLSRSPLLPRYHVNYTTHQVTEPSGFGPYIFSVATSLGGGQSCADPRWPGVGDPVTWTAVVRNRGSNAWAGELPFAWRVDGVPAAAGSRAIDLAPGDTLRFVLGRTWDGVEHEIEFNMTPDDNRDANNSLSQSSRSVAFLSYIDATRMEAFRENTLNYPGAETDDFIDWINRHSERFNELFETGGCGKRVHLDLLQVLPDLQPDPAQPPTIDYAIFPFRYRANEGDARLSGYYNPTDDIDYGLLHEMGHQLGLIDIYQFDTGSDMNQVSGLPYWAHDDLMRGCSPFIGPHSAGGMNHWLDEAHGYYGQYLYQLPDHVAMRFLTFDGQPLAGAQVEVFQVCERPGLGKLMTNQVKCSGVTDENGLFLLPNVPIDPALMPATCFGDQLHDNPFGYVAVVGTNGVLHFRVTTQGYSDYAWLDITEANVAYWAGETGTATFERTLSLGSEPIRFLPLEVCEDDLDDWAAWSNGTVDKTLDEVRVHQGTSALRVATTGDLLTLRYPASGMGQYDLSGCDTLRFWAWMESANPMQDGTPWIRLGNSQGHVEYRQLVDEWGGCFGQWKEIRVPLAGSDIWQRQEHGLSSLDNVNWLEIKLDIWGYVFTVWVDGLRLTPVGCATDCNGNGVADAEDVALGTSQDLNGNGLPDECDDGPVELIAPQVSVTVAGTDVVLAWEPVLGAHSYHVLESLAPFGPFLQVATVGDPAWTAPGVATGAPRFYRVVADSQSSAARSAAPGVNSWLEQGHGGRPVSIDQLGSGNMR